MNTYKKHIILFLLVVNSILVSAQHMPLTNLYYVDAYSINSSYAGANNSPSFYGIYRKQWLNIEGSPTTSYFGISTPLYKKLSLGVKYEGDRAHVFQQNKVQLSLAYQLQVLDKAYLRIGVGGGLIDEKIDIQSAAITDANDFYFGEQMLNGTGTLFEFGLSLNSDKYQVGLSLPQIVNTLKGSNNVLSKNIVLHGKYDFNYSDKVKISPLILYKNLTGYTSQIDVLALVNFNKKFDLGIGYRTSESVIITTGLKLNSSFNIAYSFSLPVGKGISSYSGGSHEIGLNILLSKNDKSEDLDSLIAKTEKMDQHLKQQDSLLHEKDSVIADLQNEIDDIHDSLELLALMKAELEKLDIQIANQKNTATPIEKIEVGKNYEISGINFEANSFELTKDSEKNLDEVVEFIKSYPKVTIAIYGYTDNSGGNVFNLILSKNRARAVFNYLVNKGVNSERLRFDGFGDSNPVASNDTPTGRAKNRRIEFVILSK